MPTQFSNLVIDCSDVIAKTDEMRKKLSEPRFRQMMASSFKDTARKVKVIMKKEIPQQYEAKPSWIGSNVKAFKMSNGGLNCIIPVKGTKGILGDKFHATGGTGKPKAGVRKIIHARILKGKQSKLPPRMPAQGNQPPFRVGSLVYTRKTTANRPIARVAGIGIPQMTVNRSKESISKEIVEYLDKRIEHNFARLL